MSTKILKYNPSFLNDDELVEAFVVRQATLALLLEVIRDNVHETNQHVLVIGPRGSGKTTLLRRVAAAVRQTPELDAGWFPLPFGEESYEVASAGQFWLEAVHHLGLQTGDPGWAGVYAELLREPDETRLGQRCLARLLDFADSCGKRLLLLVENLHLMLTEQLNDDDAWALRATLMNEPRLMLLGSATNRFDAISSKDKALYELFRVIELSRLTVAECQSVWNRVTGQEIPDEQARAVQILTGGNPRLLTILSIFGANRSFRSLLEDLSLLVDEHTDYFKSNFESLPSTERKVFACLATLWEDSMASDVARAARMTTSQVSALLKRLEGRGVVKVAVQNKGKKKYQLAERLYNIYYLMRRGQDGGRVRAVVNFMVQFYGNGRLHEAVADIAREACGLEDGQRSHHYRAMQMLCASPEVREKLERIRGALPPEFLQLPDIPQELKWLAAQRDEELSPAVSALRSKVTQAIEANQYADAEIFLRETLELKPDLDWVWVALGAVLADKLNRPGEGVDCLRKALELVQDDAWPWAKLGEVLADKLDRPKEGADCLRKALELKSDLDWAWAKLGEVLAGKLDRPEEGADCLRKALKHKPDFVAAWATLGQVLAFKLDRPEEGAECLQKALKHKPDDAWAWAKLGAVLAFKLGRPEEGADSLRKALEHKPDFVDAWANLGDVLAHKLSQPEEAITCLRKVVELDAKFAYGWNALACTLADKAGQLSESDECARKALALEDNPAYHGTLSRVLALRGENIPEALQHANIVLHHPDVVRSDIQEPTDVLTTAAALGYGQEALDLLVASPSLPDLEPLAAGLRQYLGLDVQAPQEVKEIGEDIVKRIEHWKDWHMKKGTAGLKS
jgi:tetratricopeptide (TPR) repeat protein